MPSPLLTPRERAWLWLRLGIRLALTVLVLLAAFYLLPPLLSLLMPFFLALLLSWLLNPLVRRLHQRLHLPRKALALVVVVVVFAGAGGILYGLIWACVTQLIHFFDQWESLLDAAGATMATVEDFLAGVAAVLPEQLTVTAEDLMDQGMERLRVLLSAAAETAPGHLTAFVSQVPAAAVATVVFVMACYFITADYPVMRCWVTGHMSDNLRSFAGKVRDIFAAAFGGYLKSQVLLSLGVFTILCVGFFAIGQNYGLLLALMLSVLDFIPIVGSGTVMVPWAVVSLIVGDYRKAVELMVVWGVICLFRQLAEPKIVGNQTGLPPILSLMSIYVGMRLGGVLGMVLGPVLTVALLNLVRLGVFRPTAADLRLAARDVTALLQRGRPEGDPPSRDGGGV